MKRGTPLFTVAFRFPLGNFIAVGWYRTLRLHEHPLKSELGSTPMTTLGVVLHGIIRSEADPLGKGAVLPLLLGEGALRAE
jgi:hypothetical protein